MADARTAQDFLAALTSEGLKIVVEPSFVNHAPEKQATIYSKIRDKALNAWTRVATVTFTGFK